MVPTDESASAVQLPGSILDIESNFVVAGHCLLWPIARSSHKKSVVIMFARHGTSKRAPVPIPRHTRRHALGYRLPHLRKRTAPPTTNHRRGWHTLAAILAPTAAPTARSRAPRDFPPPILAPAELAGAAAVSEGVEGGVLVERDEVGGVCVAEDVAAATAVVAACEIGESTSARRSVADGRVAVGLRLLAWSSLYSVRRTNLPVITRGQVCHTTERISAPFRVNEAAESPFSIIGVAAQQRGGVEAVVRARRGENAGLATWRLSRSQDGWDI